MQMMMKLSQNLHAELVLRSVGKAGAGDGNHDGTHEGTTGAGLAELQAYLKEMGALWKKLHGRAPDPELLVLSSAFKLGLFFALTVEAGLKLPESDESLDRWARELGGQMAGVMGLKLGK